VLKKHRIAYDERYLSESSVVPSGLVRNGALRPNVETLGYCRKSLRDLKRLGGQLEE
jgi:hypothetical protein